MSVATYHKLSFSNFCMFKKMKVACTEHNCASGKRRAMSGDVRCSQWRAAMRLQHWFEGEQEQKRNEQRDARQTRRERNRQREDQQRAAEEQWPGKFD